MNKIATRMLLIWSAVLLTGCMYQAVDVDDIKAAVMICAKNNAEVVAITSWFSGSEDVACSNRKSYIIQPENLPRQGDL